MKPVNVIVPVIAEIKGVPSGAAISMPLWLELDPLVGDFLFPKWDVIFLLLGSGHKIFDDRISVFRIILLDTNGKDVDENKKINKIEIKNIG